MEDPLSIQPDLAKLSLIETLLWDGTGFPRLPLHLARLTRSADILGWPTPAGVRDALAGLPREPMRVRLTLNRAGALNVQAMPLPSVKPVWRIRLHPRLLQANDPWLRIKSTHRPTYDQARATLPPDLEEWIFANERGEVCEGSITNIFFDQGQGLRTPPLGSGLLPGVLREELAAPEQVLMVSDLPSVRLWVGNALRGLIPAELA